MAHLRGKIAVVTGSARGIGAAIALALAREGADIVVNYVTPSSKSVAEKVAAGIEELGSKAFVVQANVGQLEDINTLVAKTIERFGRIDILVNNAGIVARQTVGDITSDSYQSILDINLRSVVFLSQAVVPYMGEGGRIINITSVVARTGNAGLAVYSASKAAVEAITRVMAIELRDKGIRINNVNPGPIVTDAFNSMPIEVQEMTRKAYPVAGPEEIADVVTFLASPKSRWITGSTVSANNGAVLN